MTLIAAHRGGALEWPENSPTAFRATAASAVDQVEFDIHPTCDGEIVVFHDATLERTSDGTGPVCAHTLAELKALSLHGTQGEAMLTLAEFAAVFAPTPITLRMELKSGPDHLPYPGLLGQALAVLDRFGLRGRTVVTSFDATVAAEAAVTPGLQGAIWLVETGMQIRIGTKGVIAVARAHGIGALGIRCTSLDATILAELRAAGFSVGAWAVNEATLIADMLALGVDVFTTDRPRVALLLRDGVQPVVATTQVAALSAVPPGLRDAILASPDTRAAHTRWHGELPAFGEVETGGQITRPHQGAALRIGAWNLERVLYPEQSAAMLARHGVDLALLTELDCGCHRTGQRHTTAELARMLGQSYAFGLEFLELATMPQPFALADRSDGNRLGFHGNAILSGLEMRHPAVTRLDEVADWYARPRGGQKRVGTRMAVAAMVTLGEVEIVVCSVHLESDSTEFGRALQMRTLLNALDEMAQGRPVLIAGDLNTPVRRPSEALFEQAGGRGYDWRACNAGGPTTRPSTWSAGAGNYTLDWVCTRGLVVSGPQIVPAVDADGTVLSDHDLVLVTVSVT